MKLPSVSDHCPAKHGRDLAIFRFGTMDGKELDEDGRMKERQLQLRFLLTSIGTFCLQGVTEQDLACVGIHQWAHIVARECDFPPVIQSFGIRMIRSKRQSKVGLSRDG